MKLAKTLLGAVGALTLASSGGCIFVIGDNNTGDVEFSYVLLVPDGAGGIAAATSCDDFRLPATVDAIRLMIGNERSFDGILDDGEIDEESTVLCNQFDANNDGIVDENDMGFFSAEFGTGGRDLFAVEFLDFNGNAIPWQTFDTGTDFTRFSFGGGVNVLEDTTNILVFDGDGAQTGNAELQAFFNF
jgi:hypothetical protein